MDPSPTYVPRPLKFSPFPTRTAGVLTFPGSFIDRSVTFEFQFRRDNVVVQSGSTKSRTYRVKPLGLRRFTLRYRVTTSAVTSLWSKPIQINNRLYRR